MNYLFLDSSYDLSLGVLDDNLNWIVFERHSGQKTSILVQSRTNILLNQIKMKAEDLSGVITSSGPGFYTGLRLSEGFSDVFALFGIKHFSYYSYEIPEWCGVDQGIWLTKAYRGEYFLYSWNMKKKEKNLFSLHDVKEKLSHQKIFIHSEASLDNSLNELELNPSTTLDLIFQNPKIVFPHVLGGPSKSSFYFRPPEDEFSLNP